MRIISGRNKKFRIVPMNAMGRNIFNEVVSLIFVNESTNVFQVVKSILKDIE
jgi:hypothetical protein